MLALSPAKWTYDSLYVILDVFSRYVVGWTVQHRESAALAEQLITQATLQQQIRPGQPTVHADRGSSMTSKPVAFLLADLGITKTHALSAAPSSTGTITSSAPACSRQPMQQPRSDS